MSGQVTGSMSVARGEWFARSALKKARLRRSPLVAIAGLAQQRLGWRMSGSYDIGAGSIVTKPGPSGVPRQITESQWVLAQHPRVLSHTPLVTSLICIVR